MSDSAALLYFVNHQSACVLSAEISHTGQVVSGNAATERLLASSTDPYALVSPLAETLAEDGQLGYSGRITLSNFTNSIDLIGQLTKETSGWQLLGEYDVAGLVSTNQMMHSMSEEVNHLQRRLIKDKKHIQDTLDQLKQTQTMLVHSEKMNALGKMVAGVAHEINNPLAYILSNVQLIKDEMADLIGGLQAAQQLASTDSDKRLLAKIRKEYDVDFIEADYHDQLNGTVDGLNNVRDVVNQLRSFSRLDEADRQHTSIETCLDSAIRMSMFEINKRNLNLIFNASETPEINCFPAELNQVFLNIIINAIQAMDSGDITITLSEQADDLIVSIADQGPGIAPELLEKIFDPFFTTKAVGEGIGLGLSLSYQIITDRHGGRISAANLTDKGACITISLPK